MTTSTITAASAAANIFADDAAAPGKTYPGYGLMIVLGTAFAFYGGLFHAFG